MRGCYLQNAHIERVFCETSGDLLPCILFNHICIWHTEYPKLIISVMIQESLFLNLTGTSKHAHFPIELGEVCFFSLNAMFVNLL